MLTPRFRSLQSEAEFQDAVFVTQVGCQGRAMPLAQRLPGCSRRPALRTGGGGATQTEACATRPQARSDLLFAACCLLMLGVLLRIALGDQRRVEAAQLVVAILITLLTPATLLLSPQHYRAKRFGFFTVDFAGRT